MKPQDKYTYRTLLKATEVVCYKDRRSKFFGYAFPLDSKNEAERLVKELRIEQKKASHLCYAWRWGIHEPNYRVNDDGEPPHSAGTPIYGQIQASGLTNVLVAVARVYGGTKLGVGGLIQAYKTAARMALESASITIKILTKKYILLFGYPSFEPVMQLINQENITIVSQELKLSCELCIAVPLERASEIRERIMSIPGVTVKPV